MRIRPFVLGENEKLLNFPSFCLLSLPYKRWKLRVLGWNFCFARVFVRSSTQKKVWGKKVWDWNCTTASLFANSFRDRHQITSAFPQFYHWIVPKTYRNLNTAPVSSMIQLIAFYGIFSLIKVNDKTEKSSFIVLLSRQDTRALCKTTILLWKLRAQPDFRYCLCQQCFANNKWQSGGKAEDINFTEGLIKDSLFVHFEQ